MGCITITLCKITSADSYRYFRLVNSRITTALSSITIYYTRQALNIAEVNTAMQLPATIGSMHTLNLTHVYNTYNQLPTFVYNLMQYAAINFVTNAIHPADFYFQADFRKILEYFFGTVISI
jgi:hypothetical protein